LVKKVVFIIIKCYILALSQINLFQMIASSESTSYARNQFPRQRVSEAEKNADDKKWYRDCINAAMGLAWWNDNNFRYNNIRSYRKNKIINYSIIQGMIDTDEIERIINPLNIKDAEFYTQYKNYPILQPRIQELVGEERERPFNPIVTVLNDEAVSEKSEMTQQMFDEILASTVLAGVTDQKVYQQKLSQLNEWQLNYRDRRSRLATDIINYLYHYLDLKEDFSRGFEDLLISSEESYWIDILGGEPTVQRLNPLRLFNLRSGESWKLEDSDIIIYDEFKPVNWVIDAYHAYLTEEEINRLERGYGVSTGISNSVMNPQPRAPYFNPMDFTNNSGQSQIDQSALFAPNTQGTFFFGGSFDGDGNIRVSRVRWKGMREVGFIEWYDEQGFHRDIVPEGYKPDKERGEKVIWQWISEGYEGVRLGDSIFIKLQPIPFQQRHTDNPSVCSLGIVGTCFNVNNNRAFSLVDLTREFQLLFNAFMYRLSHEIATYVGTVGFIPMHLVPNTLGDYKKMMHYIQQTKTLALDAFNEGQKGQALGKLGGAMSGIPNGMNIGDLAAIDAFTKLLQWADGMVAQLSGISPQRMGSVAGVDTVGNMQQGIVQSTYVTTKWHSIHDNTKIRVLKALVEAAKVAWKNGQKKNYILDNGSLAMIDYDPEMMTDAEIGVNISSAKEDQKVMSMMQSLAQPLAQNNGGRFSQVIDIIKEKDPATLYRKFKQWEAQKDQEAQEQQQAEQQMEQQRVDSQLQLEHEKMENDNMNKELDRQMQIEKQTIATMGFEKNQDVNENQIPDVLEVSKQAQEHLKMNYDVALKKRELEQKSKEHKDKIGIEKQRIEVEKKKIASDEKIAKIHAKSKPKK
jgi:hypothetical protein